MDPLKIIICCMIVGIAVICVSFYELKNNFKGLIEEPTRRKKLLLYVNEFEYTMGIFLLGVMMVVTGLFIGLILVFL